MSDAFVDMGLNRRTDPLNNNAAVDSNAFRSGGPTPAPAPIFGDKIIRNTAQTNFVNTKGLIIYLNIYIYVI